MMTRIKRIAQQRRGQGARADCAVSQDASSITNTDVWLIMNADNTRRANAQTLAELKTAQGKTPEYLYYFNWRSPVHDGQMKSYHTLDIPFASTTSTSRDR